VLQDPSNKASKAWNADQYGHLCRTQTPLFTQIRHRSFVLSRRMCRCGTRRSRQERGDLDGGILLFIHDTENNINDIHPLHNESTATHILVIECEHAEMSRQDCSKPHIVDRHVWNFARSY